MKTIARWLMAGCLVAVTQAEEPASITAKGNVWTLRNDSLQTTVAFVAGKLRMDGLQNRAVHVDHLQGFVSAPLFTHQLDGTTVAADARE